MGSRRYNNYNNKTELKVVTEITPDDLVSQLIPIDVQSFIKQIEIKRDLCQKRREIFAKIVPLTDNDGKRILRSYEINKLSNEEPILPLENSIEISNTKLKPYNVAVKKPRLNLILDNMNEDNENANDVTNDADNENQSESEDSSESEVEEESVDDYGDDHSSEEDNDD